MSDLFVAITGTSTVCEHQRPDLHATETDPEDLDEFRRRHESLSRHESLRDAIAEPEAGS